MEREEEYPRDFEDSEELEDEEVECEKLIAQATDKNLYITGKAGSGKTFFLKYLKSVCSKDMAILAPTGVVAINAGGQTIHTFFGLAPSLYVPNDKRFSDFVKADDVEKASVLDHYTFSEEKAKIMKALDMIIIDEVSMVRAYSVPETLFYGTECITHFRRALHRKQPSGVWSDLQRYSVIRSIR